jgi:hypothetical protein
MGLAVLAPGVGGANHDMFTLWKFVTKYGLGNLSDKEMTFAASSLAFKVLL